MINRELIRIKIVQLTYAYYQNGNKNMDNAEKELLFSLSKAYDLYNFLLALIVAITREERHRVDVLSQRAAREGEEAPSQKFAFNKFAVQLEENKMLNAFLEDKKLTGRKILSLCASCATRWSRASSTKTIWPSRRPRMRKTASCGASSTSS
jgi:N utilization substance protein B